MACLRVIVLLRVGRACSESLDTENAFILSAARVTFVAWQGLCLTAKVVRGRSCYKDTIDRRHDSNVPMILVDAYVIEADDG